MAGTESQCLVPTPAATLSNTRPHPARLQQPEQVQADIRAGMAECLRYGTTLLGDISGDGSSWQALVPAPLRAVIFLELLGLTAERAQAAGRAAMKWQTHWYDNPTCRPGFSPWFGC